MEIVMLPHCRWIAALALTACLACLTPALAQEERRDAPPPKRGERPKGDRPERPDAPPPMREGDRPMRSGAGPRSQPPAGAKVTYLGVATDDASPALRAQLDLPEGAGLVVDHVESDSPAARAGLQTHDVIHKLDDQVLFNVEQFRNLIRTLKPGQKVKLAIHRKGRPMELTAELAEHAAPPPAAHFVDPMGGPGMDRINELMSQLQERMRDGGNPDETRRVLEQLGRAWQELREQRGAMRFSPDNWPPHLPRLFRDGERPPGPPGGPGASGSPRDGDPPRPGPREGHPPDGERREGDARRPASRSASATASYSDDKHRLTLSVIQRDGGPDKRLIITDLDGNELFNGPVNTLDQRAEIPENLRAKFEAFEQKANLNIQARPPGPREGDRPAPPRPGDRPRSSEF
jgi:hypothetical protein